MSEWEDMEEAEALEVILVPAREVVFHEKGLRLSASEERELIRRAQAGDKKAMQMLLDAHAPFVTIVMRQFTVPSWVPQEDIRQEGLYGLMDGIKRFDLVKRKTRLLSYAAWRIHKALVSYFGEMAYPVKMPFPDVVKLKKVMNRLEMGHSAEPELDETFVNHQRHLNMLSLLGGCLPLGSDGCGEYVFGTPGESDTHAHRSSREFSVPDHADAVVGTMVMGAIIDCLRKLPLSEGLLLGQYYGIYVASQPVPIKYIAGEAPKATADGRIGAGWNGYGVQIGESYNSCSKLIRQVEAKFRLMLLEHLGRIYADYTGRSHDA